MIAASILLLSLFSHTSAQNRGDDKTLEGLQNLGLVLKYGNADGLDTEEQPATLQMLHDRARKLLKEAEIPLLESTDEAGMKGRPRLVFTVTVNKKTETAPAVYVESSLYERVRLWRDEKKEIDLATWVMGGVGGPTVRPQLLLDVFDEQVKGFVKAYRAANSNRPPVESGSADQAAQLRDDPNTLEGLPGVRLFVSSRSGAFDHPRTPALIKMLQSEAEKKFKQAGISLLQYTNESESVGRPLFYVFITLSGANSMRAAIEIESKFWQRVRPVRDPRKDLDAVTWESKASDNGPNTDDAVLQVMNSQLDEFIMAFIAANPKVAAAPK